MRSCKCPAVTVAIFANLRGIEELDVLGSEPLYNVFVGISQLRGIKTLTVSKDALRWFVVNRNGVVDESDDVWVNSADYDGRSSLHFACARGLFADALRLLERGANVNAVTVLHDVCPLHLACKRGAGEKPMVLLLLEWGANINARERHHPYATPLYYASGTVRALLRSFGAK